jgi:TatD DNase family protein
MAFFEFRFEENRFMYIDSHAHLFSDDFALDLDEVLQRARDAGIDRIVVPGTDNKTSREALVLAEKHDFIYACVGIHPHEAAKLTDGLLSEIESMTGHPKVVAIGEIGLDYHYDFAPKDVQHTVFKAQIDLAMRKNLPIVVHTRESLTDTISVVEQCLNEHPQWRNEQITTDGGEHSGRGVFHCFTGTAGDAAYLFNKGFFVSYPGIVTFKNSPVVETLRQIGCENVLLETDSPYMAPVPLRGKRSEPAHIVHVGKKISEILGQSEADIARVTSLNASRLFGL